MKALIVYGSTTGNTERVANLIKDELKDKNIQVKVKNVRDTQPEELKNYDLILLGSSTWSAGELQDDFVEFEENLKGLDLNGKKAAAFGCGDSEGFSDTFCKAVDILEKDLRDCGADIIIDSLKIDGDVKSKFNEIEEWSKNLAQRL